jgi:hypothetical protein
MKLKEIYTLLEYSSKQKNKYKNLKLDRESLQEGKIKNLAAVLALSASLATANPNISKVQQNEWLKMNYQQKIEYVNDLFSITKAHDFPDPSLSFDIDMSTMKKHTTPAIMVNKLDTFYSRNNRDQKYTPAWLALLEIEKRIPLYTADKIIYNLKTKQMLHGKQE